MRKFKLFHIVSCLLLFIMVVSGCGNSGKASESDTDTREETAGKTYTIDNIRDYVVGVVSFNFSDVNSFHLSRKMSEIGAVATRRGILIFKN